MDELEDDKYFKHKRKGWVCKLNENCEHKTHERFRERDVLDLFPPIRGACLYPIDKYSDWGYVTCDTCKDLLQKYEIWLETWMSNRSLVNEELWFEIYQLRKEIREIKKLLSE